MHLNINHIHLARLNLVSSCYERWCVDINHIAPQATVPTSRFTISYADPASGRPPDDLAPAWQENQRPTFDPKTEAARTTKTIADAFDILSGKKKPLVLSTSNTKLDAVDAEFTDADDPTTDPHK
jgi:hypothetical protein